MLIFLDTEFTGLDQRSPSLISIGLVTEDGGREFYAELPESDYLACCDPWVFKHILALLDGHHTLPPGELKMRLQNWISELGNVRIVTDSPECDFTFLRGILDPWPASVAPVPLRFDSYSLGSDYQAQLGEHKHAYFGPDRPPHHALHDAKALRQMWVMAKHLPAFQAWAARVGL
ncbi:MAG: 3'-5' exoribonuclease [Betaproteobacteria bacterium]|nr:3'-5' exoribonuclease [Betaproteobacteria bacterium]